MYSILQGVRSFWRVILLTLLPFVGVTFSLFMESRVRFICFCTQVLDVNKLWVATWYWFRFHLDSAPHNPPHPPIRHYSMCNMFDVTSVRVRNGLHSHTSYTLATLVRFHTRDVLSIGGLDTTYSWHVVNFNVYLFRLAYGRTRDTRLARSREEKISRHSCKYRQRGKYSNFIWYVRLASRVVSNS